MKGIFKQKPNPKKNCMLKSNIQKCSAFSDMKTKRPISNYKIIVKKPIIKPMSHKNIQNIPDLKL
jgi:hypothetical protein